MTEEGLRNLLIDISEAIIMAVDAIDERDKLLAEDDKIRAELHATAEMHENGDYYLREEWIDEIFDKYKASPTEAERSDKE